MSHCCPSSSSPISSDTHKQSCPKAQQYAKHKQQVCPQVSQRTILHHLKEPWLWQLKQQSYYFCRDPKCDVVYFGHDQSIIRQDELRTIVGIKEPSENATLCYCFGVTHQDIQNNPQIKAFVIEQTKTQLCACDIRNPSGKCCLGDFPHHQQQD